MTIEEVKKIASLARIELSEAEALKLQPEMTKILDYVEALKEVDTEGVVELSQVTGLTNVFREDKNEPLTPPEDLFKNAPAMKDGYIKVKSVF